MTGLVAREDRLKRFTATSHAGDFSVMGRTVRLETTSLPALRHARRAMEPCGSAFSPAPRFFVRIVSEATGGGAAERGKRRFFAAEGLWLEHLGARCFFAIDTDACMAVAYAPDDLAASEAAFTHAFLGPLLDRIASAFGLMAVPAACLVIEGRGVLLFGSESDRLAVSHLTAKLGLEICSHQTTFLELDGNALLAWRRAWSAPAEAEEFSPIPRRNASAHRPEADIVGVCRPVSPVFAVFLEGESSERPALDSPFLACRWGATRRFSRRGGVRARKPLSRVDSLCPRTASCLSADLWTRRRNGCGFHSQPPENQRAAGGSTLNRDRARTMVSCLAVNGPAASVVARLRYWTRRDWEGALGWLHTSGLALYFRHRLRELGVEEEFPSEVRARLSRNHTTHCLRVAAMRNEFNRLNRCFTDGGIRFAALKGFSLVPEYCADATLRTQYDFDYLVAPESGARAGRALRAAAYAGLEWRERRAVGLLPRGSPAAYPCERRRALLSRAPPARGSPYAPLGARAGGGPHACARGRFAPGSDPKLAWIVFSRSG